MGMSLLVTCRCSAPCHTFEWFYIQPVKSASSKHCAMLFQITLKDILFQSAVITPSDAAMHAIKHSLLLPHSQLSNTEGSTWKPFHTWLFTLSSLLLKCRRFYCCELDAHMPGSRGEVRSGWRLLMKWSVEEGPRYLNNPLTLTAEEEKTQSSKMLQGLIWSWCHADIKTNTDNRNILVMCR